MTNDLCPPEITAGITTTAAAEFLNASVDANGRVFTEDGHIFRGLSSSGLEVFRRVYKAPIYEELVELGMIQAEPLGRSFDRFVETLWHPKVEFVSYCQEWPLKMLLDAAILQCRIMKALLAHGLAMKDAHPWNVAFDFTRPVFLDWGSIIPVTEIKFPSWFREFRMHYYTPLWLASSGRRSLARRSMQEHPRGPIKDVFASRIGRLAFSRLSWIKTTRQYGGIASVIDGMIDHLESFEVSSRKGEWSDYTQSPWKVAVLREALPHIEASTLIDLAANKGAYATIATREFGYRAVALDLDEHSIEQLYEEAQETNQPILPLVMDVLRPTPPFGMGLFNASAQDRLSCDLGLALGLTHHLAFKTGIDFATMAKVFERYAKRAILVEFVPSDDEHVRKWIEGRESQFDWYNESEFVRAFASRYRAARHWNCPHNGRFIYLFEK
jgi:hypothetical protein